MDLLIIIIVFIVIILCVLGALYYTFYNRFQDVIIRINEVEATIDNNLRNKFDLINRSIPIIKANSKIDKEIFTEIVKLRSRKLSNFELDRVLVSAYNEYLGLLEEDKKLKESEEINKISDLLIETDNTLVSLREYYNYNITRYNKMLKTFPTNIVASIKKYKEKLFYDRKDMNDSDYEDFKL